MSGKKYFSIAVLLLFLISAVKTFMALKGFNLWAAILCFYAGFLTYIVFSVFYREWKPRD